MPTVAVVLLLAGCSAAGPSGAPGPGPSSAGSTDPAPAVSTSPAPPAVAEPTPAAPTGPAVLADTDASALAVAASAALLEQAPLVVLAPTGAPQVQARAAGVAVALGMPMLLAPMTGDASVEAPPATPADDASAAPSAASSAAPSAPSAAAPSAAPPVTVDAAVAAELSRLGAATVLAFGDLPDGYPVDVVAAPDDDDALADLLGLDAPAAVEGDPLVAVAAMEPGPAVAARADAPLPATRPAATGSPAVVLSSGAPEQLAAVATARAVRAPVVLVPSGDPRSSAATVAAVQALAPAADGPVLGLGPSFGDAPTLGWRTSTAATGRQLPGGGQTVLPGKTYVALYGTPVTASLGVLGEQGPEATIQRAKEQAAAYEGLTGTTVVPALEIIATVASSSAGSDGNYSNEWPVEVLRPLVDLAAQNDVYVVIDLQPGRSDFLTQAQQYEELLRQPHVGLALDPEWRLAPDEVHLRQIGSVGVDEVNGVITWLADLTRREALPQKMLVLHQFQVRMIPGVDAVDQSRSELSVVVHVDGQGSQPAKQDTWAAIRRNAPAVQRWGWKNFIDEDSPTLTPEQTVQQVQPVPDLISYQ